MAYGAAALVTLLLVCSSTFIEKATCPRPAEQPTSKNGAAERGGEKSMDSVGPHCVLRRYGRVERKERKVGRRVVRV